jgi:hypothetical protein
MDFFVVAYAAFIAIGGFIGFIKAGDLIDWVLWLPSASWVPAIRM